MGLHRCSTTSLSLVIAAAAALTGGPAHAYSYSSVVSDDCHETLAGSALRAVRASFPTELAAIHPTDNESALIDDLPFKVDHDMRDLGGAAFLIGVRDNDLKGRSGIDSTTLATVHGNPDGQREHCLRRPEHDEPNGTKDAIDDCRKFILDLTQHAITYGLDGSSSVDPARRTTVAVWLAFAGKVQAELPIFYVYMGEALHALEDSFTHAFRDPNDFRRVTVALNWIDVVNGDYDERRDGPPHMVAMDQCHNTDDFRTQRKNMAIQASTELLTAAIDPTKSGQAKTDAITAVLDTYLSAPDPTSPTACTYLNRWCDAPENQYRDPDSCACRMAPAHGVAGALIAIGVAATAAVRRMRRRRRGDGPHAGVGGFGVALLLATASTARAEPPQPQAQPQPTPPQPQPAPPQPTPPNACVPGLQIACACPAGATGVQRCTPDGRGYGECGPCAPPELTARPPITGTKAAVGVGERQDAEGIPIPPEKRGSPWAFYAAAGAAIDHAALQTSIGVRYYFSSAWIAGADAEWNPWISYESKRAQYGSFNAYGTLIRRYRVSDTIHLRTSAHLGVSVLLFSLYGAPAGTFGPYIGANLLGVEFKLSQSARLVIDPADIAFPVPHISGAPLSYREYRFTFGVEFGE